MALLEAFVLLGIGLVCGILSTTLDVIFFASSSFLAHVSLLVLLLALIAVHVESRLKAIWWSIPFTLGFVESYFLATTASYEGFSRSTVVPLAALALASPLLAYALWTAKNEKNVYGKVLSLLMVAGTLGLSYVVNAGIGVYDVVICLILAFVLLAMPTRKIKITRAVIPHVSPVAVEGADVVPPPAYRVASTDDNPNTPHDREPSARKQPARPTKRRSGSVFSNLGSRDDSTRRRRDADQEQRDREQRLRRSSQRRARRREENQAENGSSSEPRAATLGNARVARPSTRSR